MCFMVFTSIGRFGAKNAEGDPDWTEGYVMIIFVCLFIAAFASTWGLIAWVVASAIYPGRYCSETIALRSASNCIFDFLIAFFTNCITGDIGFGCGYAFGGCNLAAVFIVFFVLPQKEPRRDRHNVLAGGFAGEVESVGSTRRIRSHYG
jgi:MFS transporter, SP family, sugar:H+ symporter